MTAQSGVSINTNKTPPDASAMLDVNSAVKGVLLPRVSLQALDNGAPIVKPATGLIVYNTNNNLPGGIGLYYNNGTGIAPSWVKVATTNSNGGWLLTGNSATDPATNFIGTTDDKNVVFKRGDIKSIEILEGGTVVFTGGPFGWTTPAGAGKRLEWIPFEAAFRAGEVEGKQWDFDSIGPHSFAVGKNTLAYGGASIAMGDGSAARKYTSIAMGKNAKADNNFSVAIGDNNLSAGQSSVSIGSGTMAYSNYSVAIGNTDTASASYATALGFKTNASGIYSTAMGHSSKAQGMYSFAAGNGSIAKGAWSIAMGDFAYASSVRGLALTGQSKNVDAVAIHGTASGQYSISLGGEAMGDGSVSIGGGKAIGIGSVSMGSQTQALSYQSIAAGYGTLAIAMQSFVIGHYNDTTGSMINPNVSKPTDVIFQVGNGKEEFIRSNALTLYRNGAMAIAGDLIAAGVLNPSDIRLKKDIQPLLNVLSKFNAIQPITYNFKDESISPGHQIGFSAQEIENTFPELVKKNANGFLSVNYPQMTAVAFAAIKEQQLVIKALEERIQRLEKLLLSNK